MHGYVPQEHTFTAICSRDLDSFASTKRLVCIAFRKYRSHRSLRSGYSFSGKTRCTTISFSPGLTIILTYVTELSFSRLILTTSEQKLSLHHIGESAGFRTSPYKHADQYGLVSHTSLSSINPVSFYTPIYEIMSQRSSAVTKPSLFTAVLRSSHWACAAAEVSFEIDHPAPSLAMACHHLCA